MDAPAKTDSMLHVGTPVLANKSDRLMVVECVRPWPTVDGTRSAYILRAEDHQRFMHNGHSHSVDVFVAPYDSVRPACDIHPCGDVAEFGDMMCAGCKRGAA